MSDKSFEMPKMALLAQAIINIVIILLLSFILPAVLELLDREPQKIVIEEVHRSEQITFFKILILNPDLDMELARTVAKIVDEAARDFDRDPDFIISIMYVESRFDPTAESPVGARGLMQVMPLWLKIIGGEGDDLFDPVTNVRRGLQIYGSYEQMLKSKELALTAYNRGSWRVEEDIRMDKDPRNGYAKEILDVYERLKLMQ